MTSPKQTFRKKASKAFLKNSRSKNDLQVEIKDQIKKMTKQAQPFPSRSAQRKDEIVPAQQQLRKSISPSVLKTKEHSP